jgi:hypothetical protein
LGCLQGLLLFVFCIQDWMFSWALCVFPPTSAPPRGGLLSCYNLGFAGLCSPQFRLCLPWLPDTLLKWTPFAFMTFGRCTVADPSISSSKSSQEARRTALPSFPSVMPTECNPLCGRGCIQL